MIGGFIMCGNEWESFLYCRKLCVHERVYMCNAVMCDAYGLVICGREERTGDKLTFTNNCGFSYYREKNLSTPIKIISVFHSLPLFICISKGLGFILSCFECQPLKLA